MAATPVERRIRRLLREPMRELRKLLNESDESSLALEANTGVSSSVIRAIRNGQTGDDMMVQNWSLLVQYLLRP